MSKGARHRAARKREQERQESFVRLYHGTTDISWVTGPYIRARGMKAFEPVGLLLCRTPELARDHALAATARALVDGFSEDRQGLIVEVILDPARVTADADVPGHWWVKPGVRPNEVGELQFFDASEDLADEEFTEALAGRFDRFDSEGQDWRRAGTGEMEE